MADRVQEMLERMVPELEDLEQSGVFSEVRTAIPEIACSEICSQQCG